MAGLSTSDLAERADEGEGETTLRTSSTSAWEEPLDRSKHWGELDEEEEEEVEQEVMEDEEMEEGIRSVDTISSTPAGGETPDVTDLRKSQRKEPEKQAERLYKVLEQKEERIAAATLFGSIHTYVSLIT